MLGLALTAAVANAGSVEIALHVGRAMPTFEQTLSYDASGDIPSVPGVTVQAQGPLVLNARGDISFSGGLTWFFAGPLGVEARLDGLTAHLDAADTLYSARFEQPPLPVVSAQLVLGGEDLELDEVRPVSLNLRLASSGRVRVSVSGGVSHLGALQVSGTLSGSLTASVGGTSLPFPGASISLKAVAPPEEEEKGQYGANAGLALQIGLSDSLALSVEARGFVFKERTLTWSAGGPPANALEEALQRELLARLEPIRFTPTFFSVNAGLSLRF
jgi:hypothetical protein